MLGICFSVFLRSCVSGGPAALFHAAAVLPPDAPGIAKALSAAMGWAYIITSFETTILRARKTVNGPDFEKSARFLSGFGRLRAVFGF